MDDGEGPEDAFATPDFWGEPRFIQSLEGPPSLLFSDLSIHGKTSEP